MPVQILSAEEREVWSRFPERIEDDALGAFFTLTAGEAEAIRRLCGDQNRLAVALQVCSLRWLGFIPDDLWSAPGRAVSYLAEQLDVAAEVLTDYRASPRTRSEHARVAQRIARFGTAAGNDLGRLHWRLLQAALEHDSLLALLREACRWLRSEQLVRPGLTVLERTVSAARMDAERAPVTGRLFGQSLSLGRPRRAYDRVGDQTRRLPVSGRRIRPATSAVTP